MKVEVFSDGSGTTSDKPGGYGFVVTVEGVAKHEGSGYLELATNNDAELQAAIAGLDSLHYVFDQEDEIDVWLVADSEIILGWADGTRAFHQLEKLDRFQQLRNLMAEFKAKTRWVPGHTGNVFNERCDKLANAARKKEKIS
jgi:ribonuclease HI